MSSSFSVFSHFMTYIGIVFGNSSLRLRHSWDSVSRLVWTLKGFANLLCVFSFTCKVPLEIVNGSENEMNMCACLGEVYVYIYATLSEPEV